VRLRLIKLGCALIIYFLGVASLSTASIYVIVLEGLHIKTPSVRNYISDIFVARDEASDLLVPIFAVKATSRVICITYNIDLDLAKNLYLSNSYTRYLRGQQKSLVLNS
jgi:hypothetical protein